jgi:putative Ca2+/H+ antiporter (TMEM165/GDT1 family)
VSLSIVAVTFGVVFLAELPDKTMIASILLASRHRPLPVWVGSASAMVVNSAVAVAAGRLLALAPHRVVDAVVAVILAGTAVYLLVGREATQEREGEKYAGRLRSDRRVALSAFAIVVLAELGDVTQLLTANLAAHYRDPWSVFVGATVALVSVTSIGVFTGRRLVRVLPLATIRKAAGAVLGGFAVYAAVKAATG